VTLIRDGLSYVRLPNPTSLEALIIQVNFQSKTVTIVNTYHAPNKTVNDDQYRLLFQTFNRDAIILGDLNAYSTVFGALTTDNRGKLLEELMDEHSMVALNTGAGTYVRRTGVVSHLDISMANYNIARVANWSVSNDTLGSDHLPVIIKLNEPAIVEEVAIPQWSYSRADWDNYKAACRSLLTSDIIDDDVVASRDRVVTAIIEAAESSIPVTKPTVNPLRKSVPFWTDECTQAVRRRNKAKNKMQRTRDLDDQQMYYRLRGVAQYTIKEAEKQYWRDYCSTLDKTSNMSQVWGTVKKMSGARSRPSIPAIVDGGVVYNSNKEKAALFAKKFAAVSSDDNLPASFLAHRTEFERAQDLTTAQQSAPTNNTQAEAPPGECDDINAPFEIYELTDALRKCKSNSSPGDDRISYVLLKQIPRNCQIVLLQFFNKIWRHGILPPDWKRSIVIPLLKADRSAFDVASYRPIALTSTLCKVMERMAANRLRWWLESNQRLNKFQAGFRQRRSTIDQIIRLADDAHKAVNNKQYTLAVMLDLEKAFDLVWHRGLIFKMRKMGLNGNILNFVTDFLSNRSIRVRVGAAVSNSYELQNGTPQGSVISPLLFLLMVDDIEEPENGAKLSLFADDSAVWKSGSNVAAMTRDIQRYLDRLTTFFERWGFKLSASKTVAIVFTRNQHFRPDDVQLTIGGCRIKVENTVRFLGVIFDKAVTWTPHIDQVVARCNKRLNLLKVMAGTRWGASKDVLLLVYKALIRSLIDYGSIAYDTASHTAKAKLESIQYKALKICCGAMVGTPLAALQVECGQPPLAFRRQRMMADYALKVRSIPDHPSASTLEDCWQFHYANYPADREPFGVKVNEILKNIGIDDVPITPPTSAPWIKSLSADSLKNLQPLKIKIRDYITHQWQERWDYSDTGQCYRDLHPIVGYKIKSLLRPRHKDVQITRLRLGHVRLGEKLHTIGQRPDPLCAVCHVLEDVEHFLTDCSAQKQLQDKLRDYCRENSRRFSLKTILTSEYCTEKIYDFIKSSGSFL